MAIGKISQANNISFKGCDKRLDLKGKPSYLFYYPHSSEHNLQLELLKMRTDNDAQLFVYNVPESGYEVNDIDENEKAFYRFKLTDSSHTGKEPKYACDNGIIKKFDEEINGSDAPFTQIFPDRIIVSKPGIMQLQMPDMYYPGMEYKDGKYLPNQALRAKALSSVRTHVGKLGGTLDGITSKLSEKADEGYTRIVGTPFTKDEISSHLYWTQNAYRISSSLGGMESMKRFQKELFRTGINFVSDAALVNEGLQGIHIASLLKWGADSPFFNWFKTYNLDSMPITLGVIPKDSPYVRMKIVNSPVNTEANPVENSEYNPNLPTYVQFYDSRLVSQEQEKSNTIFTKYDKEVNNHYEISKYDDAVIPYSFSVNPNELKRNINKFSAFKKGDFCNKNLIKNILNFSNFKIGDRQNGGIEMWDGNVDIAKLNFSFGNYDFETINSKNEYNLKEKKALYQQGLREVQDYAVLSGKYWAKLFADTQLEYAASAFKNVKTSDDALRALQSKVGEVLPKSVLNINTANNKELIENVLNNDYFLFKLDNISSYTKISNDDVRTNEKINSYQDYVTKAVMNLPIESLGVADDVASILSSGYLTKRAGTDEQIGLTRFDIYKSDYPNLPKKYENLYKRTDKLLTDGVYSFVDKVMTSYFNLDGVERLTNKDGKLTDFAKYVINAVVPELTKYALIKALDQRAEIKVEDDGNLNFDNVDSTKLSVKTLGIEASSPEKEAEYLIRKFEKGVKSLNSNQPEINKLASALYFRLKDLNENSFKLADMIMDRTESGIGLRVDAAKDISAIDSVREGKDSIEKALNDTINFWSRYVKDGIQSENPHAYSTAEVTDIDAFIVDHKVGDYISPSDADRKMLEKIGVTSLANYTYLFSMPIDMYSYNPETGSDEGYKKVNNVKIKLDCLDMPEWRDNMGMLFQGPADSSIHSYTFSGNHDKPRILHVLGLDMKLFKSDFSDDESLKTAMEVLNYDENSDFYTDNLSAPAIAMGKRLKDVFYSMKELSDEENDKIEKLKAECKKKKEEYIPENDSENKSDIVLTDGQYNKIRLAIARLAEGVYQIGDNKATKVEFNADSFGQKPFDVVINDVLKTADLGLSDDKLNNIANIALKKMLAPAMEKYRAIYKMLIVLPGDPTDFAGDKEGLTGFELKSKNITQQNRNAIRWEWLSDEGKKFISDFKNSMDKITALRTRPELSALNNGNTLSLINYHTGEEMDKRDERKYSAILRYNAEGSQVIGIITAPDLKDKLNPNLPQGTKKTSIEYLNLAEARLKEGIVGGLNVGSIFKNADSNDKSEYIVEKRKIKVPKVYDGNYNDPEVDWPNYNKKIGYVEEEKETYVLQRYVDGKPVKIEVDKTSDNALILYRVNN